jgi:hypothetical protein
MNVMGNSKNILIPPTPRGRGKSPIVNKRAHWVDNAKLRYRGYKRWQIAHLIPLPLGEQYAKFSTTFIYVQFCCGLLLLSTWYSA